MSVCLFDRGWGFAEKNLQFGLVETYSSSQYNFQLKTKEISSQENTELGLVQYNNRNTVHSISKLRLACKQKIKHYL